VEDYHLEQFFFVNESMGPPEDQEKAKAFNDCTIKKIRQILRSRFDTIGDDENIPKKVYDTLKPKLSRYIEPFKTEDLKQERVEDCLRLKDLDKKSNKQQITLEGNWIIKDTPLQPRSFGGEDREAVYGICIKGSPVAPKHLLYLIEVPGSYSVNDFEYSKLKGPGRQIHINGTRQLHQTEVDKEYKNLSKRLTTRNLDVMIPIPQDMAISWPPTLSIENGILEVNIYAVGYRPDEQDIKIVQVSEEKKKIKQT